MMPRFHDPVSRPRAVVAGASLALVASALLLGLPADAADVATAAAPHAAADLTGLATYGLDLLAAVLMAVSSWAALWVQRHFKVQVDASTAALIDTALTNGIHFAIGRLEGLVDKSDLLHPDIKSQLLHDAIAYANEHVPDALTRQGLTPERLETLVEARLGKMTGLAESTASPAAPASATAPQPAAASPASPAASPVPSPQPAP